MESTVLTQAYNANVLVAIVANALHEISSNVNAIVGTAGNAMRMHEIGWS